MILTSSTEENVVSKNHNRLHMDKERGVRNNPNVLDMKYWRMVAMQMTEPWWGVEDGLHSWHVKFQVGHKNSCGLVLNGRWSTSGNVEQHTSLQDLRSASLPGKQHSDKCFQPTEENQPLRQVLQEPGTSQGKEANQLQWKGSIFSSSYISCWNE